MVKTRTEGNYVCSGWLADQAVTICKGSCVGLNACLGSQFQSGSSVGEYACRDGTGNSCQNIRSPVPGGSLVTIKNNACQGYYACGDIESEIVTIGDSSCVTAWALWQRKVCVTMFPVQKLFSFIFTKTC